jgi:hypothetical protein
MLVLGEVIRITLRVKKFWGWAVVMEMAGGERACRVERKHGQLHPRKFSCRLTQRLQRRRRHGVVSARYK